LLPVPGWTLDPTLPPWASTISRTIISPSPLPAHARGPRSGITVKQRGQLVRRNAGPGILHYYLDVPTVRATEVVMVPGAG
jgi:hypothetical protein